MVDYGRSNLLSVCRALAALGAQVLLAHTPQQVRRAARRLVLPGVGAVTDGMAGARLERGLAAPLLEKARAGTPLLGICLGMQMLFEESSEGGALTRGWALCPGACSACPRRRWTARRSRCRTLAGARCSPRAGAKIFPARPLRA